VFFYSLTATIVVLTFMFVAVKYSTSRPVVEHLPSDYDFRRYAWMSYVPMDAEKASALNFSQLYLSTGNNSLFPESRLLKIYRFKTVLNTSNTEYVASVYMKNPNPNLESLTLNIIKPKPENYDALCRELEQRIEQRVDYRGRRIYQVTVSISSRINQFSESKLMYVNAYVSPADGHLLYSEGARGLEVVEKAFDASENPTGFFDQPEVKAPLYLLNLGDGEVGFSFSTFPSPITAARSTAVSLLYRDGSVITREVLSFDSTTSALNSLSEVKKLNFSADSYSIFDNHIVMDTKYGPDLLLRALRGL